MQNTNYNQNQPPPLWPQVLIATLTLAAVAVAILFSRQTYRETQELATEQFNQQQLILARSAAAGIESYLDEINEELPVLAMMPPVQAMAPESLVYMQLVYGDESGKASIRLLDKDGILRFIYPNEGWQKELIGRDYGEEAYFLEAQETGERAISGVVMNEMEKPRLLVAYPVFIEDEKGAREFNGVVIASFDIEEIARFYISPIVSGETGYAWLLDEGGVFLAHYEAEFVGREASEVRAERNLDISYAAIEQIQRRMLAGEEGTGSYVSGWHRGQVGKVEKLVAYTPVHVNGQTWSVAVCAPVSEVDAIVRTAHRAELYTLGLVIVALMAGGLYLLVTSRRWSHSLEREVEKRTGQLRESEERFRSIFENTAIGLYRTTPDGRILMSNPALARMLGSSSFDELSQRNLEKDGFESGCPRSIFKQRIESEGQIMGLESVWTKHDGNTLTVRESAKAFRDEAGNILYYEGTVEDITERVRADDALRESTEKIRAMFESTTDGIVFSDLQGNITAANKAAAHIHKFESEEELIGRSAFDIIAENDRTRAIENMHKTLDTGHSGVIEYRLLTKDGREFDGELTAMLLKDTQGNPSGFVAISRDITGRVRAQEKLRESEEQYRGLFERVPVGLYRSTPGGQILDANPVMVQMLGYPDQETLLATKAIELFVNIDDRGAEMASLGDEDILSSYEIQFRRRDGAAIWVRDTFRAVRDAQGQIRSLEGSLEDITERVQAEESLRVSEEKFRLLAENSIDCIWMLDTRLRFTYLSPASESILGYKPEQMVGTKLSTHFKKREFLKAGDLAARAIKDYKTFTHVTFETKMLNSKNEEVDVEISSKPFLDSQGKLIGLQGITIDITERVQARKKEQQHFQGIEFLTKTAMSFVELSPEKDIYRFIGKQLKELAGESIVVVNSIDAAREILTLRAVLGMGKYSKGILRLLGRNPEGTEYDASHEGLAYLSDGRLHDYGEGLYSIFLGEIPDPVCRAIEKFYRLSKIYTIGFIEGEKLFGTAVIFLSKGAELESKEIIETFVQQASIAIQRQLAQESLQRSHRELTLLNRIIAAASTTLEPQAVLETTCRELALAFDLPQVDAALLNEACTASLVVAEYLTEGRPSTLDMVIPIGTPATQYILKHKAPLAVADAQHDPRIAATHEMMRQRGTASMVILPLLIRGQVVGTLGLESVERREFSSEEINLAANAAAAAAQALEIARLFTQANQRLERMEASHTIDQTISASMDLKMTVEVILEQAQNQLGIDAVDILVFDPALQSLNCAARRGFKTQSLGFTNLRLGNGLAGKAALEREVVSIPDLGKEINDIEYAPELRLESFVAYWGAPLIAKGKIQGVLELFHRTPLEPDYEWLKFMNTLAGQAAIAIDNANLFENLQKTNMELSLAYDTTLEGWAHALELHDMETEGHSRRVTDMTLRLAKAMGMDRRVLVHVRRGALLHDIGKMGVPDSILNKSGPLTDEEWDVMRMHPVYSYEMLSSIPFLRPAIDIPYSHHEKWDGSGYPLGLKGDSIPLPARIFAIIDVYDALRYDRPYRDALTEDEVLKRIREQSGKYFDPRVVDAFLEMIGKTNRET